MRRRALLGAALSCAAVRAREHGSPGRVGAYAVGPIVARGEAALWAARPGEPWQRLPGTPPLHWAPEPGGLWVLAGDGRLQRWGFDGRFSLRAEGPTPDRQAWAHAPHAFVAGSAHALLAQGDGIAVFDEKAVQVSGFGSGVKGPRQRGAASAVFHMPQRRTFVVAWPASGELWEIPLDRRAPPLFEGLVHDWRLGEGIATPGYLGIRRTMLGVPLPELTFADADASWLAGLVGDEVRIVHLDVRRQIASLVLPGARPQGALLHNVPGSPPAWWLPQGEAVQLVDPTRWRSAARHGLGIPVRAMLALGERVCAWVGPPGGARLLYRQGDSWQPIAVDAGAFACASPSASHLLVAGSEADSLRLVDSAGRLWPLPPIPEPGPVRELRWLAAAQ